MWVTCIQRNSHCLLLHSDSWFRVTDCGRDALASLIPPRYMMGWLCIRERRLWISGDTERCEDISSETPNVPTLTHFISNDSPACFLSAASEAPMLNMHVVTVYKNAPPTSHPSPSPVSQMKSFSERKKMSQCTVTAAMVYSFCYMQRCLVLVLVILSCQNWQLFMNILASEGVNVMKPLYSAKDLRQEVF